MERERARFIDEHPRSRALGEQAGGGGPLLSGVPMNWMTRWPGDFPIWVAEAEGARLIDVDGIEYVDFCLGDTGAMTGHAPAPTVAAIAREAARGLTTMLPSEDGVGAGEELRRRFGMPLLAVHAVGDRRQPLRPAPGARGHRAPEGPRAQPLLPRLGRRDRGDLFERRDRRPAPRHVGPQVDPAVTTRVVEINDLEALERELAHGDVAAVLVEPALTNIGIVLAEPGYHDALRALTRASTATLLVIDETHTFCCGPGGYTARLRPGAGRRSRSASRSPAGCRPAPTGSPRRSRERVLETTIWDAADVGGIGGTLAGNALVARRGAGDARARS